MKIFISGALGHIGSKLIREISTYIPVSEIIMIDNMMTQRYPSLFNLSDNVSYSFIEGDVLTTDLRPIIKNADIAINLAAITDAAGSFDKAAEVEKVNYQATVRAAEACIEVDCPLIHLSSTSVYGTQEEVVDEDCSEDELQPQSPYAETKLKEERLLQELSKTEGLRFVTCRFGTIAGISSGIRFHTAVNKFCWQAVMGQPLTVWRTALHQKRPYLDLNDAIRSMAFIIEKGLFQGNLYNVLTENLSVESIINSIKIKIPDLEIKFIDTKIMNQLSYDVANKKFINEGFQFKGSIRSCIEDTINMIKNSNRP
jgi:UDP-glucose 4-epimerase